MNTPMMKKTGLDLGKLSSVAKIAVNKRPQPADAEIELVKIFSQSQVRKHFRHLEELAESIRLNGIIEPLVVHEEADGRYRVIVGERRLRAAPLAGLSTVPVLIKRGLTELQVRRMQVAENNDRDDLSAFEQATGVIEDVERHGKREAMLIWNRGEAWISKRMAVQRYPEPLKRLLEQDLCGDFEVLHCLKQIYDMEVDHAVFERLRARLEQGGLLSREDAREQLAGMRAWRQDQESLQAHRDGMPSHPAHQRRDRAADKANGDASDTTLPLPLADEAENDPHGAYTASQKALRKHLKKLRAEAVKRGEGGDVRFAEMQAQLRHLGHDRQQTEWVLWQAFLATVAPMLEGLGPDRALVYVKQLQRQLKGQGSAELVKSIRDSSEAPPEGWRLGL